jgi:hypothetical protein
MLDVPPEQDFARSDALWIIRLVSVIPKMRHKLKKTTNQKQTRVLK